MQGLGTKIHWEMRKLFGERQLWRTGNMLHQMTLSGSLLQTDNADQLWRDLLSGPLKTSNGQNWASQFAQLALLPRSMVRYLLWHTSMKWYNMRLMQAYTFYVASIQSGMISTLLTHKLFHEYLEDLEEYRQKLEHTEWIQTSAPDFSKIDIEEKE